jgi:alpha-methylacyl-CoA racemase
MSKSGPLTGVKVLEIAGIGPGPFCAMMLADMGADVIRVDRTSSVSKGEPSDLIRYDLMNRGRRSIAIDLKKQEGVNIVLALAKKCDVLIEGFRPKVAERLGIGPDEVLKVNPSIIYGRMTGWGQDGPYSNMAGHDINYISLTGALSCIGPKGGKPVPPLNLVGDFGGGGLILAFGVVCALYEAKNSGKGQVVDAAMVDGASILMTFIYGLKKMGFWENSLGSNLLDGGSHFYNVYETKDNKYISLGAIEPQFYQELLKLLEINDPEFSKQMDRSSWPKLSEKIAETIKRKTRQEWEKIFENSDACVAPVLSLDEAPYHHHNQARGTFVEVDGVMQPAPAPRFSRTPGAIASPPSSPGDSTREILEEFGFDKKTIDELYLNKVIA